MSSSLTKIKMNKSNMLLNCLIAFAVSFMAFVFAPMELYFSNKDYFFFGGMEVLKYTLLFGMISFVGLSFLLIVIQKINGKIWQYCISIMVFVFGLFYFQGNFWLVDYGILNGEAIDWSNYYVEGVINTALWIIGLTLGGVVTVKISWHKLEKSYKYVCVCILLIQCVSLITLSLSQGGINKTPEYLSTNEYEFEYSKENNLIVIMLDSFDATVMSEIVNGEDGELYRDILRDFTFYPDTTGMYSYTALAVPYILTGDEYLNDMTYGTYLEQAYSHSPVLNKAKDNNWRIGIYNDTMMPRTECSHMAENVKLVHNTVSSHRRLLEYYYRLIAYKYMPQIIKQPFWLYPDEMKSELIDNEEDVTVFSEDNFVFRNNFINAISGDSTQPTFRFYTLFGAHQPYHTTENFDGSEEETDVYQTSKGLLKMVDEYLDGLRESNVYDNSNIVILADHGIHNRINPMFIIKYADNSENFSTSDIAFSYSELQRVFVGLIDGLDKNDVEKIMMENIHEERRFLSYRHSSGFGYDTYFENIEECAVLGKPNSYSVEQTGIIYSKP